MTPPPAGRRPRSPERAAEMSYEEPYLTDVPAPYEDEMDPYDPGYEDEYDPRFEDDYRR